MLAIVVFDVYNEKECQNKFLEVYAMAGNLSVSEAARLWGVKPAQVTRYCREGRIEGAEKRNGEWRIPEGMQKPGHGQKSIFGKKALPVGISSYKEACGSYYYVDKTMLIKEFLDERPKVSLFTRPRRFGKTLTMDMLRVFFEKSEEDTSAYFFDRQIWQQGEAYRAFQGKYPVIYLSFKDAKKEDWTQTREHIIRLITSEFRRHKELKDSERILNGDYYHRVIQGEADADQFDISLRELTQMLHEHHGIAPIVIIDEYDTPIQQGYSNGFYKEVVDFIRNLFSGALKDNEHLSFGFLTGILRVAKESIFSGLNNLKIYSVLDNRYGQYFGFTADEVREMSRYYHAEDKFGEICDWYDGYRFGDREIFNPWSVINYFSDDCQPRPYWENTGNNTIVRDVISDADEEILTELRALLQGEEISALIDTNVIYPEIRDNPSSVYSFLLMAGYLKTVKKEMSPGGDLFCRVSLPNREITYVYRKEIIGLISRRIPQSVSTEVQEALYRGDSIRLQMVLQRFLLESVSHFDLVNENSYHMMLIGMCAILCDRYYLGSNHESGKGRYDISLTPKSSSDPGILIELKYQKEASADSLGCLAKKALEQIREKQYDSEMKLRGIRKIFRYGVAFSGKNVAIETETDI